MNRILTFASRYWVELVMVPPFLLAVCYFLYGDSYFASTNNFVYCTLPWLVASVACPVGCHWVRNNMLRRFPRFDDWGKRVIWSISGYLIVTVGVASIVYLWIGYADYADVSLSSKKYYILVIMSIMCVLIGSTMYESVTYFDKLKNALTETEQLEKLHLETQFQSLQNQLNPHFLFNSLNVLSSLIAENPRRAEDFVDELSNVYRYLLRSNERELASVGEELRFIRSFFHLLETRHDTGVTLNIDVKEDNFEKKLPALALQILVENAVKHNEINPDKPLNIEIFSQQCAPPASSKMTECYFTCQIVVRNNLQRKSQRAHSNNVGLDNLRQRYDLLGIQGFDVNNDGEFFTVTLPLIEA
jgi:two-component system LytT family sensor kinase